MNQEEKNLIRALALKARSGADSRLDSVVPFGNDGHIHLVGHQTAYDIEDYVDDALKSIFMELIKPYASQEQIDTVDIDIYDYIAEARDYLMQGVFSACNLNRISYLESGDILIEYADGKIENSSTDRSKFEEE